MYNFPITRLLAGKSDQMKNLLGEKNMPISTLSLNTKIGSTMLCLSGFELYSG